MLTFYNYGHPSRASMKVNEDVLEGFLNFFGYNIETHCEYPPLIKSKSIKKRKETITDGMDEIIAEREGNKQITSDTSECKEVTDTFEGMDTTYDYNGKNTKKRKCINYIDKECDEKIVPPKKKVSFQNPPLSDFKIKVVQKNINERKDMEKFYGINNLAKEFKKKIIPNKDYVKE